MLAIVALVGDLANAFPKSEQTLPAGAGLDLGFLTVIGAEVFR